MDVPEIELISAQCEATQAALLELNNANASATSPLMSAEWSKLTSEAFCATCIPRASALLIALDQDANYDSANFKWFSDRLSRFVYVDRIIVSVADRGKGLASRMYRDLFRRAQAADHDRIVCEVNLVPPNPGSDAFHTRMGFTEVGRATLIPTEKEVRYFEKSI